MLRSYFVLMVLLMSSSVYAYNFTANIDVAEWHLEPSPLQCRLWQPIPQYGIAVFEVKAGDDLQFYLESDRPASMGGSAELTIKAPFWRPESRDIPFKKLKTSVGPRPVLLGPESAQRMMDELIEGMIPSIQLKGWSEGKDLEVGVSAVNFQEAYNGMISCLATLYPANYQQLQYSYLLFGANKYGIKGKTRERLDLIAGYLMLDPDVTKIYVYGHASREGRRGHNWELSRLRAKEVKDYLVNKGVDPSLIVTNFFGETRPRFKGTTAAERAKNRRVYVRLRKAS